MAATIVITCPECAKQIKAPADLEGKKIRCKGCGNTFVVRASAPDEDEDTPAAKPAKKKPPAPAPAKAPPKPKAKAPKSGSDEEEDNPNPYDMTYESLAPRCPHCAGELESEDAVVCLHCGYNRQTRGRHATTKTIQHNWLDWTLWLGPGIFCVLLFFGMIGAIVFILTSLTPIIEDAIKEGAWWAFAPRAMQLWGVVFSLAIMFFCARFAIKRLIFRPRPPEKIKEK